MQNDLLETFLEHLLIEKGLAKNTLVSYKNDLQDFIVYLFSLKPMVKPESADEDNIKSYLNFISNHKYSAKSQARKLSALKSFYAFLLQENMVQKNPANAIQTPKLDKSLPKALSEFDIKILLEYAHKKDVMSATMLEILYATGIRVSELVALKISDIKDNFNFLLVLGKGDKEREVPLTSVAKKQLEDYILWHKNKYKKTIFLFPSKTVSKHITREGFAKRLKQIAISAGLDSSKISPHKLRHSFATHMLEHGSDLKTIKDILGHADIATTEIYTSVSSKHLQKLVNTRHPLNKNPFKD